MTAWWGSGGVSWTTKQPMLLSLHHVEKRSMNGQLLDGKGFKVKQSLGTRKSNHNEMLSPTIGIHSISLKERKGKKIMCLERLWRNWNPGYWGWESQRGQPPRQSSKT